MDESITVEERLLQIEEWATTQRFSVEILRDSYLDMNQIGVLLRRQLAVENLASEVVRYPATWWQAAKKAFYCRQWLPRRLRWWLRARWPIREKAVDLTLSAVYPDLALPNHRHRIIVRKGELPLSH